MKRLFDILCSFLGLLVLFPVFLIISILIIFDSKGGAIYMQPRVGKNNRDFLLCKFRTMVTGAEKQGQLTVGAKDSRITNIGHFLRSFKLDELPQLFNVLVGDMSLVGPRPEVRKYVEMYDERQRQVLSVRPGITDYASIEYSNENEMLGGVENPEELYINRIMPAKLDLNLRYIEEQGFFTDLGIIFRTLFRIFR